MLNRRFNNHHHQKRCPICGFNTGKLLPQSGPLKDLGYPGSHYAHIVCVVKKREELNTSSKRVEETEKT